ncbi:hypothetical protein L6452_03849 [Arctium lappa]|uniref:Uncharacterized protein n=1 Tax=Arctium lappa TaxID=4217 RepID=A0ACB9FMT2_ARCLA|nr:hypothetical protein L6452_03849 [Arctium lappa]
MKEDDSNWFSKWEEQLPNPEELMPLTQTLITPDLAIAFDIGTSNTPHNHHHHHHRSLQQPSPISTPSSQHNSGEFDSSDLGGGGGGGGGGDEPARTLKRPRLVWTPQLHKRFVDAVAHLGIKNAVPKTIMQLMSVDGLTRENVASHLQKYRLYLKRMQGLSSGGGGGGGGGFGSGGDSATDRLFASSPVPPHFLHQPDNYLPYMPAAALQQQQQQHHHHQQMAAVAVAGHHLHRHFGSNHQFLSRQSLQPVVHRVGTPVHNSVSSSYVDDLESAQEKKALTLFPTGDD